ncbi:LysR family transcriptional regulator [Nocardia bovistercoris]|uniref:LysR family transcriptional regulator n=1 Tax=Nocardia bovistercoris TaxID=2785916 RepID=A0A931I886_9NOCA|nr:LysR family transcriptional regulator [Nocardia bovistercoris]MBH0776484.1 LysR family transcriptional regulator [Nocardia bovistercoris]
MLDVRRLRLLRELANRETITAVAEALSYTPSAVSQQLTALEREAGVPLLVRTGRRVTLTPTGAWLVRKSEVVFTALAEVDAELARIAGQLTGTLRIGVFPTAVRAMLTPALVALSRDHPDLELRVTELDPATAPDALRAETLDIALVQDYDHVPASPDPALDTDPLLRETIYLAATAEGALDDHRDQPWILATPGTLCHAMTVRACEAAGFTPRARHIADDFGTVLALVAACQGVALVPELGAGQPPDGVVLTPLPLARVTRLAYRRGTGDHPVVAAGRSALRTAAALVTRG